MLTLARRQFLGGVLAAVVPTALSFKSAGAALPEPGRRPPLCVFSKHLQFLDCPALGKTCRELGLDGIDLTVRDGGHVAIERVATALPEALEQIRTEGLDVPMITTRFLSATDGGFRDVLETAGKCGIPFVRIGYHQYAETGPILPQVQQFAEELRGMAAVAEKCGVTLGYHNHSGENNVGAPLWDLHRMFETVGSERLGSNFDVGHAMAEGPYGNWQITARLLAPWVRMVAVKDFVFDGNKPKWVPLGEGLVDVPAFLRIFREQAAFAGPISLHFEYKTASNDALLEEIGRAVQYMRKEGLPKSGYIQ